MRKVLLLIWCFWMTGKATAQDLQFSQFYASPLFLNPAFAGSNDIGRIGFNFRNQWPGLNTHFNSFSAYGDVYKEAYNSGIGIVLNGSRESLANLQTVELGLIYAYRVKLTEDSFIQMGIQGSMGHRSADFGRVVLGTQLDLDKGQVVGSPIGFVPNDQNIFFGDLGSGLLFSSPKTWLGLSAYHLLRPMQSFYEMPGNKRLIRYSAHGGIRFDFRPGGINDYLNNSRQERTVSFAFNYRTQGLYDQLDLGTEFYLAPLVLGIWYRGLPSVNTLPNNEAVIGLVGFSLPNGLDIGYSFDFTLSALGFRNTGGAHEISIRYSFVNKLWQPAQRKGRAFFKY